MERTVEERLAVIEDWRHTTNGHIRDMSGTLRDFKETTSREIVSIKLVLAKWGTGLAILTTIVTMFGPVLREWITK